MGTLKNYGKIIRRKDVIYVSEIGEFVRRSLQYNWKRRDGGHRGMEEKIKILDLDVDILAQEQLLEKVRQQFHNNKISTSIFVTTKMIERSAEDEAYQKILNGFDILLPGESEVFSNCQLDMLKSQKIETDYRSFLCLLQSFAEEKKNIYMVGSKLKSIENFLYYCDLQFPALSVAGTFFREENTKEANILNDINVVCPDVVLIALPSPLQEKWMQENANKISGKLCIGIGSILPSILEDYENSDNVVKKNIMVRVIKKVYRVGRQFFQRKVFRMELNYYSQKKKKSES